MANFGFSLTGPRRNPTADERANGFPCGAADQLLFNGLQHRLEAELGHLLTYAGLTPTDTDFTQVRQAVQALIDAATGGGETENYLLLSQAASRLPIFPAIETADGRINITVPGGGVIRVPGGVTISHRGISPYVTAQTDFNTVASRTSHLRWTPTGGFVLKNLADNAYNPDAVAETDRRFDSTYDDMLVARIVTNAGNVATITPLANKDRFILDQNSSGAGEIVTGPGPSSGLDDTKYTGVFSLNWARTPAIQYTAWVGLAVGPGPTTPTMSGWANRILSETSSRYGATIEVLSDYSQAVPVGATVFGGIKLLAVA